VYSRLRGMLVAVEETAAASGKQAGETTVRSRKSRGVIFSLRQIAFAALALVGALPSLSSAQMVPGGAHAPSVIQTQNGLDQVNINRPSGAGVSMNTYGQFDVQQKGAILNNSPIIVQTQQAGMINGNPNFGPGQAARVIVNQVNSEPDQRASGSCGPARGGCHRERKRDFRERWRLYQHVESYPDHGHPELCAGRFTLGL
jgi:filamentous hemagglutinin